VSEWRPYRSRMVIQARPYVIGESLRGISIPLGDKPETLQPGGMILRDPQRPTSMWYVGPRAFADGFEEVFSGFDEESES
jgi:hypothetical protein